MEIPDTKSDITIGLLQKVIRGAVRILAVFMTIVILLGTVDVGWMLWVSAMKPPRFVMTIQDILATFGAFMAVLIAIEIFVNIALYLRDDVIHVKIVMATGLMAIAGKIIILNIDDTQPGYLFGLASIVLAMSVGYWLVHSLQNKEQSPQIDEHP